MKRINIFLLFSLLSCLFISAGKNPKWMKKVRQAQVSVIAYDDKDEMHESQGVFVDEKAVY